MGKIHSERSEIMQIICFHNPNEENGYLSNWYMSPFTADGIRFSSMEQFMTYSNADLFGDRTRAAQIFATEVAGRIKELGRLVSGYDDNYWNGIRQIVVYEGLYAKFSQNEELKRLLRATGKAVLAECAVKDRIWGIGMGKSNPDAADPAKWRGTNLLGFALTEVRDILLEKESGGSGR